MLNKITLLFTDPICLRMDAETLQGSRLEKYSRLLLKEIEVHEKMERASKLAVRHSGFNTGFVTPERTRKLYRTYTDGPFRSTDHNRLIKAESLQAMSQTWDENRMRKVLQSFGEDNTSSSSSTSSIPREVERCMMSESEKRVGEKLVKRKPSAALIQRKKDAEARNLLRTQRLQSLEKDCQKAQWMIYRMKAMSMPSLRCESTPNGMASTSDNNSLNSLLLQ